MKRNHLLSTGVLATMAALLLSGCLVRRTVTKGGSVVTDHYVVKRPIKKDAVNGLE